MDWLDWAAGGFLALFLLVVGVSAIFDDSTGPSVQEALSQEEEP